jgi:hypothetical protein
VRRLRIAGSQTQRLTQRRSTRQPRRAHDELAIVARTASREHQENAPADIGSALTPPAAAVPMARE